MYNTKKQYTVLFFILLLALLFRILYLNLPNLYFDEHNYLVVTKFFVEEKLSPWDSMMAQPPPLFIWINSIFASLFGISEFGIRIVSVIFGILTIFFVYLLTKKWYGTKYGLLASALLSVLPIHVLFSRLGFIDVMVTFFIILTIYTYEFVDIKNRNIILFLTGLSFGLSLITKFSALTVVGLYFIFTLIKGLFLNKDKLLYYKNNIINIVIVCTLAFTIVLLSTGFKLKNLFILLYGFIYLSYIQTTLYYDPFYYIFLVSINALSPLIYLVLVLSIFYLSFNILKNKNGKDFLLLSIIVGFILIAAIQGRTSPRHLVLISPFIAIIVSRTIILFSDRFKKVTKVKFFVLILLFISFQALWSYYEVEKDLKYSLWGDVGNYINQNLPENAVVKYKFPYFPIIGKTADEYEYSIYTTKKIKEINSIKELNDYDYFLVGDFSENSGLLNEEPLKGDIVFLGKTLFKRIRTKPYPILEEFAVNNSKLIEIFYCNGRPCLYLYQLQEIENIIKEKIFAEEKWSIFNNEEKREQFFIYFCSNLEKNTHLTKKLIPEQLIKPINNKCGFKQR